MNHAYYRVLSEKVKYLTLHNFLLFQSFAKIYHCIISYCFIWEAISKTRASCFIRGSKHLETIKALGLRPRAFITFSVFGTPDETLALVFDILLKRLQFRCHRNKRFASNRIPMLWAKNSGIARGQPLLNARRKCMAKSCFHVQRKGFWREVHTFSPHF